MNDGDRGAPADGELNDAEREALDSLPREMIPPAGLEERVVGSLKAEGLLADGGGPERFPGAREPRRRVRRPLWLGWVAAAAAGVALFASGMVLGQRSATRGLADAMARAHTDDLATQATRVQEAGSEYVRAVARLAELAEQGDEKAVAPGREAATVALHAAALELARLSPDDAMLHLVLTVLEDRRRPTQGTPVADARSTIWF